MKKIVITGGLGHTGSYLVGSILKNFKGVHLIIIDTLLSQRYPTLFNLNKNNLNKVSFYDQDIRDFNENHKIFANTEILIHLAAKTEAEASL